jgi:hypothetical protein
MVCGYGLSGPRVAEPAIGAGGDGSGNSAHHRSSSPLTQAITVHTALPAVSSCAAVRTDSGCGDDRDFEDARRCG